VPGWGQKGGQSGTANKFQVDFTDRCTGTLLKVTDRHVPAGSLLRVYCGGGGGYGSPSQRAPEAIKRDLLAGIITTDFTQKYYPHAW
jgi:N-methylhydantoinase B